MTIGIYRLVFSNTTKCYVGQSINIEKRFTQHCTDLRNDKSNFKMLETFKQYGSPSLEILLECNSDDLDKYEEEAIQIFDSVTAGLNIYNYVNQAPIAKGTDSGNSKYSKTQLIEVYNLLATSIPIVDISSITKVPIATIGNISRKVSHIWLQESYPELCSKINDMNILRKQSIYASNALHNKTNYCALSKGIIYPPIKSPEGTLYRVANVQQFAKDHNLPKSSLHRVLTKESKQVKGWKLCQEEQV